MPAVLVLILSLHSASAFSVLLRGISLKLLVLDQSLSACVPRFILVLELDSTNCMNTTSLHEPRARSLTRFLPPLRAIYLPSTRRSTDPHPTLARLLWLRCGETLLCLVFLSHATLPSPSRSSLGLCFTGESKEVSPWQTQADTANKKLTWLYYPGVVYSRHDAPEYESSDRPNSTPPASASNTRVTLACFSGLC